MTGHRNLPGRAAQQLVAGDLLHKVGIDGTGLQELDAVFQMRPLAFETCELFLGHGEARVSVSTRSPRVPQTA